ncbi:MAG: response regulator [Candidatus Kerfeldbacteria bacterium CG_4_10_14_0_8_um_filter_42_10]|uniref:Response regulator n=1 Tax=Candidatus Kerfeldbacteria bacterium CG_4_10_14_0_8_um_filter_42_10 TaxID=2014248 RepID=A0A2M7RFE3_9BACT|nr:MAG: response regulator [Candidatus Kerfeldbacteria bacterium CG_4_10_14_0_8_um_filter_42_10]
MTKKRVLIIEDEVALLYALQSKLSIEGFEAEAVSTGKEGLKLLQEKKYDLLILDIILPDTDGFEILKQVKENPKTKAIPCVIISNLAEKDNIERGISLGAKDYLPKSQYHLSEIIDKIKSFLE